MDAKEYVKKYGRPPKYRKKEEIQAKIDEYFQNCEGKILVDAHGSPVTNKKGIVYRVKPRPPTITGLALALGFSNRQSLLNYQGKKEFFDTITRAKARVELYNEERLFDKDGCAGAKFNLSNNFEGWAEKVENTIKEPKLEDLI